MAPVLTNLDNFGGMRVYSNASGQGLKYELIEIGSAIEFAS